MDKSDELNVATALLPLVQYIAAQGNGDLLARVIDDVVKNIGDEATRAPAKGILTYMASVARNVQSQKAKKG